MNVFYYIKYLIILIFVLGINISIASIAYAFSKKENTLRICFKSKHNKPKDACIVHLKKLGVLNGSRYKIIQSNKKVGLNFVTIDYDSPTTTDIIFEPTDPFDVVSVIKEDGAIEKKKIPYILLLKGIIKDKENKI